MPLRSVDIIFVLPAWRTTQFCYAPMNFHITNELTIIELHDKARFDNQQHREEGRDRQDGAA
jgi:hypothetical protein